MKPTWSLYSGVEDESINDIPHGAENNDDFGADSQPQGEYPSEQGGGPMAIRLRARNKALEMRVRLLEKELAEAKAKIAELMGEESEKSPENNSVEEELVFSTISTKDQIEHARHTLMSDPLGIDSDVIEKPIDVSHGRSSSLSRESSFGGNGGSSTDENSSSVGKGLGMKTKSGRDMLLGESPDRRGSASSDLRLERVQSGRGKDSEASSRSKSTANLFEEIDRDAEEERQLHLKYHAESEDNRTKANSDNSISGAQTTDSEDSIVETPSDTYRSSEAKRSRGYRRFLDNFRKREAIDLLTDIKRFVTSVLMPHKNVYGNMGGGRQHDPLEERAAQWFAYMDTRFRNHRIWEEASEEEIEEARGKCMQRSRYLL